MLTPAFILAMKSRGSPPPLSDAFEASGGIFLPSELGKMELLKRYTAAMKMPRARTTTSEEGEAISVKLTYVRVKRLL